MPSNSKEADSGNASGRVRRSSRRRQSGGDHEHGSSNEEAMIAPGFGTKKDLIQLSKDLSEGNDAKLPVEAVEAMMHSRGRGVRSSARVKGESASTPTKGTNGTGTGSTPVSSAWADFMKDEGFDSLIPGADDDKAGISTRKSRSDAAEAKSNKMAKASSAAAGNKRPVYDLEWLASPDRSNKRFKGSNSDLSSKKGILLMSGTLDSTVPGRSKLSKSDDELDYHLPVPTRILPNIYIQSVYTSSHAVHSIACDVHGNAYGWGRNDCNQLTSTINGGAKNIATPTVLDIPKIKSAALGKSHTLFLLQDDDQLMAVGLNKVGQCGINRSSTEQVNNPKACVFANFEKNTTPTIVQIACGEDFSLVLDDEGFMYSTGSSEFGQLGNGETGEYFVSASKMAFSNCHAFTKRATFCHAPDQKLYQTIKSRDATKVVPLQETMDIRIASIACGKHHSLALEAPRKDEGESSISRVFSWGCGDYGVLGHGVQADEYYPRLIATLSQSASQVVPSDSEISAGAHCSLLLTNNNGYVYYWGMHKRVGEAVMKPQLVDVLANNQHHVSHFGGGGQTVVCSTTLGQTIAWGQGPYGELGLGSKKSSSKPAFVESLHKHEVIDLACGYGHTLWVVHDTSSLSKKQQKDDEEGPAVEDLPKIDTDSVKQQLETIWSKIKTSEKPTKGKKR